MSSLLVLLLTSSQYVAVAQNIDSLKTIVTSSIAMEQKEDALWTLSEELAWLEPTNVMVYTDQLKNYPSVIQDSSLLMKTVQIQGKAQRCIGNYGNSLELYHKNYTYHKQHNNLLDQAFAAHQIGLMNLFNGNMNIAQRYLLEAYDIYQEKGTPSEIALSNNSLANFYIAMDQEDKAFERYNMALKGYEEANDLKGQTSIHTNLGLFYLQNSEFKKSDYHLKKSLKLATERGSQYSLGFVHDFIGLLRKKEGKYEEAYKSMMKALIIRNGLESHYNICETQLSLAGLRYEMKMYDDAIVHANSIFQFQDEQQSLSQQESAYRLLAKVYEKKENYEESLISFKQYKSISDSIYSKDMISEIAEKDAQFEKVEHESEIALLNTKNESATLLLNQKSRTISIGAFALIAIGVLVFFLFQLLSKYKKQKHTLSLALNDKELLIKEIHHRVKNNLQIVSSLLSLQSRHIDDKVALEAINTSKARVRSMALLHQNLYSNDDLKSVKIKHYFDNLGNLYENYQLTDKPIFFNSNIADIELDIDSVVPLGLIANELITNAHKHAFKEQEEGQINLSIFKKGKDIILEFDDNGNGIPFTDLPEKPTSLGLKLIRSFAKKLNAEIKMANTNGTSFMLKFPIKTV